MLIGKANSKKTDSAIDINYCPSCSLEIDNNMHSRIDKKKDYPFDIVICKNNKIRLEIAVISRD